MSVAHGHVHAFVTHEFFDRREVHTGHDQTTGECVPQVMKGGTRQFCSSTGSAEDFGNMPVGVPLWVKKIGSVVSLSAIAQN